MNTQGIIGVICCVLSAALYGLNAVIVKKLTLVASISSVLFFCGLFAAILMACALKSRQKSLCPETPGRMKFLLLYGLLGFAMTTTLLQSSYLYLPVGTATTIHYLFPLLVNLGGLIFFRESLHKVTLVVLAGVLCGIIFLAGEKEGIQIFGIALAFASSITWAFHMLYLDHSVLRDEPTLRMVFWQSLLCSGAGAILSVLRRESLVAGLRPIVLGGILLSALCSNVFACGLLNVGIRRTGSAIASIVSVFEPISSIVFGGLLLKERLTGRQETGIVIILLSILVLLCFNATGAHRNSTFKK